MKRILISPMDWGLGHATRCMPIINVLLDLQQEVILAGAGDAGILLKKEYPNLEYVEMPAYNPSYQKGSGFALKMLTQLPHFINVIEAEHKQLNKYIDELNIDAVISDNRYGCYSSKVPSVIITHQLNIQAPKAMKLASAMVNKKIEKYLSNFNDCWVPDYSNRQLSGELSKAARSVKYIGALSRFKPLELEKEYEYIAVISGPEPQRTLFEDIVTKQLLEIDKKALIVCGKPNDDSKKQLSENVTKVGYLTSLALNEAICKSDIVIARSGYSTIMDLAATNKKAILVPTPAQTEQEYLANHLTSIDSFFTTNQSNLDIEVATSELNQVGRAAVINQNQSDDLLQVLKQFIS